MIPHLLTVAREIIWRLDQQQDRRQLMEVEIELRRDMKLQCLGLASLERTIARQRSRIRELREGDANTRYFHLKARGRRRKTHIANVRIGEATATTPSDLAQAFHDHFSGVMGTEENSNFNARLLHAGCDSAGHTGDHRAVH